MFPIAILSQPPLRLREAHLQVFQPNPRQVQGPIVNTEQMEEMFFFQLSQG